MSTAEAKDYLQERHIPRLFESLLTGLMYYRPEDPINYLELCLQRVRDLGGPENVQWDTFLCQNLPPINGNQGKKSTQKSEGSHMRRHERLPPIQSQFSIDSDSDMTESSGLIQEYDVFDPNRPRPKIIFVIGGPGSGKGTQSTKMASHFGFMCISVGEILRNQLIHHASSDRKWELIAQIISKGELAPPETTIEELKQQFINHQDATGFVVDGFPRDIGQAFTFEEQIGIPDLVIFLACSSQRLRQRLERRSAQQGRPDDNAHAIDRRLETFKQNLPLIVKYYQDKGLIARFDADREENCIFKDICCAVQGLLFPDGLGVEEFRPRNFRASISDEPSSPREAECKEQGLVASTSTTSSPPRKKALGPRPEDLVPTKKRSPSISISSSEELLLEPPEESPQDGCHKPYQPWIVIHEYNLEARAAIPPTLRPFIWDFGDPGIRFYFLDACPWKPTLAFHQHSKFASLHRALGDCSGLSCFMVAVGLKLL
ncbi:adenylate kinase isoenzyme 5-like [Eleutherodactylus coqui]|uniref:adenylate kinase isoenzyme 5-like n=1 Tax=Eleutherodactylus coqui TaxID=57060 RepID=UPI003461AFA2